MLSLNFALTPDGCGMYYRPGGKYDQLSTL